MIWTSAKFQTFEYSCEISPDLSFDSLVLLKVYKISAKKSLEELCLMEKLIRCFKNNKNLVNFDLSTRNSHYFYFDWFLLCEVHNVWPKEYKEVSFMTLKSGAKFEEKLTCGLENDLRNMANFHHSTWKSENWDFDGVLLSKVENIWR